MQAPSDEFTPLHKAIIDNDLEGFASLLRNPDTDINIQNQYGQTPLFVSLENGPMNSFTTSLVQAGCDVKISDNNKATPLHRAMLLCSNEIAQELIKRGADIDAQEEHVYPGVTRIGSFEPIPVKKRTPLHDAIQNNNLEGICMLLYYGADVTCSGSVAPFKYAACKNFQDIVEILNNFYDESYYTNQTANDYFQYQPFRLDLELEGTVLFVYSFQNDNTRLAKSLWDKINFESILDEQDANSLLAIYIKHSRFSTSDWLKYLYLIFQIFITRQFAITCTFVQRFPRTDHFFYHLLNVLHEKHLEPSTRLGIVNTCLSLGAPIWLDDLKEAHKLYGFGEELEALIYGSSYTINNLGPSALIVNVLGLGDFSHVAVSQLFHSFVQNEWSFPNFSNEIPRKVDYIVALLGLFSLPLEVKQEIKSLCCDLSSDHQKRILESLDQIPNCPTLLELSRNQARKHIRQTNLIKYPYHFHDAIKQLNFPQSIKDLIRFKTSLY